MYTKIELGENAELWESYLGSGVAVKWFTFVYEGITDKSEQEYVIYYKAVDHKDKFVVKDPFGLEIFTCDSLAEAKAYLYSKIKWVKDQMDLQNEDIKLFIEMSNKKKGRKKKDEE